MHKIAVIALHPIQYQAGLWRSMHAHPDLDVHVYYLDTMGIDGTLDPSSGAKLAWDLPLLDGYNHSFLRNFSPRRFLPIIHRINPGLLKKLLEHRYDAVMVHGHLTLSNWIALLGAKLTGSRLLYRGEGSLSGTNGDRPGWTRALSRSIQNAYIGQCQGVAYSCKDNKRYLTDRGATSHKLFPMLCAVDNELLRQTAAGTNPQAFRKRHAIAEHTTIALSTGRLTDVKRMQDCIEAFRKRRAHHPAHLCIAGDGEHGTALIEQVRRADMQDCVTFLGFMNQTAMMEAVSACDFYIQASSFDPSPKAMAEAIALGKPIVCSDQVGTAEDFVCSTNGFIYPCRDTDAMADIFDQLIDDPAMRKRLGQGSLELAQTCNFDAAVASCVAQLSANTTR